MTSTHGPGPFPGGPPPTPLAALSFALLLVGAGLGLHWGRPPTPPATPSESEFHEARARAHLERLATGARVPGSAPHDSARVYLERTLTELGFQVEIHESQGLLQRGRWVVGGRVRNVVARLPASGASPAPGVEGVAVMAHYDSVEQGPGGGDDASGVAAALEIARAIRAGPPLPRDFWVVLTDLEEPGLLGAEAFMREHPARDLIGVFVNLEARGSAGPAFLFETSPANRPLVRAIVREGLPRAFASSFFSDVYRRMPNDTDLTMVIQGGAGGVNLAFAYDAHPYHSRLDRADRVREASLHHLGSKGLAVVRALAETPARDDDAARSAFLDPDGREISFFSVGGRILPFPSWLAWMLLTVGFLSLVPSALSQWRRAELGWDRAPLGLLVLPVQLLAAMAAGVLPWLIVQGRLGADFHHWDSGATLRLWSGAVLMAMAAAVAAQTFLRLRLGWELVWIGTALLLLAGGAAVQLSLPGAAYLLILPAVLLSAAVALTSRVGSSGEPVRPGTAVAVLFLGAALAVSWPALFLWAPVAEGLARLLGNTLPTVIALSAIAAVVAACCLPGLERAGGAAPWRIPVVLGAVGAVLVLWGARSMEWSPEHPQRTHLDYAVNTDSERAVLLTLDPFLDPWKSEIFGQEIRRSPVPDFLGGAAGPLPIWRDAPFVSMDPLEVQLLGTASVPGGRRLRLLLSPPDDARQLELRIPGTEIVQALAVQGVHRAASTELQRRSDDWVVRYILHPGEEVAVELQVAGTDLLTIHLQYRIPGLPERLPGIDLPPRPLDAMEGYRPDGTLVNRTLVL